MAKWSLTELEALQLYDGSADSVQKISEITGRTPYAVQIKASREKLCGLHPWDQYDAIIDSIYDGSVDSVHKIAEQLGIPFNTVKGRILKTGRTKNKQAPRARWTPEEDALLVKMASLIPFSGVFKIVRRLQQQLHPGTGARTRPSVRNRLKRKGLEPPCHKISLTIEEVCYIFCVNQCDIANWQSHHGFALTHLVDSDEVALSLADIRRFLHREPSCGKACDINRIIDVFGLPLARKIQGFSPKTKLVPVRCVSTGETFRSLEQARLAKGIPVQNLTTETIRTNRTVYGLEWELLDQQA